MSARGSWKAWLDNEEVKHVREQHESAVGWVLLVHDPEFDIRTLYGTCSDAAEAVCRAVRVQGELNRGASPEDAAWVVTPMPLIPLGEWGEA